MMKLAAPTPLVCALVLVLAVCTPDIAVGKPALLQARKATRDPPGPLSPELEPVSHKDFFGRDYPDDHSPRVDHHFSHPYPEVQDSDAYDKDYVRDQNDDGGEWKAQMEYDNAKNKLQKERAEMEEAKRREQGKQDDVKKAKDHEADAEKDAKDAEKSAADAEDGEKAAEGGAAEGGDALAAARKELEREEKEFKNCEKELEKAKARVKALEDAQAGKLDNSTKAQAEVAAEKAETAKAEKAEEAAEKEVKQKEEEEEKALKSYEEEQKDVDKAKADLDAASSKLKKFRSADAGGGVERNDKPGFVGSTMFWVLIAAVVIAICVGVFCVFGRGA